MVNKKDFLENSGKKYPSSSSFSQNRCLLCRVGIGMSSSKGLKQRERRSLFLSENFLKCSFFLLEQCSNKAVVMVGFG